MTESISVTCLIDRYWDTAKKEYSGTPATGTMIAVGVQSDDLNPDVLIPVGIVKLTDGTFQSVPMEFINAIQAQ